MSVPQSSSEAVKFAEQSFINGDIDTAIQYAVAAMIPDSEMCCSAIVGYITAYMIHEAVSLRKSWYTVLAINDHSVDTITIKKQYKKLALRVHPDKNSSVAAETAFKIINEALEVLSDPYKRQAHDSELELQSKKRALSARFTNPFSSWLRRFDETQEPTQEPEPERLSKRRRSC